MRKSIQYLSETGRLRKGCPKGLSSKALVQIYRMMMRTRIVDAHMITLQRQGVITFALSSLGEEACAVAAAAALATEDWIYPQYREVGAFFWRGGAVEEYLHHMLGNAQDKGKGRQMPNHFGSRELNIVTVASPVATHIVQAAGCAYGMKIEGNKRAALCFFGEGAASEGDFHAGLNFAAVRQVPAIFFCRNNGYAISTGVQQQFATEGIAARGAGYGIPTFVVDGNDVFALYHTVREARRYCVQGKGPVLIEALTYRMGAHSTSDDPTRYRSSEEEETWAARCPILRVRRYLEREGLWSEKKEETSLARVEQEVAEAIAAAKAVGPPALSSLFEDVYFEVPEALRRQLREAEDA